MNIMRTAVFFKDSKELLLQAMLITCGLT